MEFLSNYVTNKDYFWIYIHGFLYNICRSVLYVFTAGFLYQQGLSIPLILLFFGFEFGIRGILSPFGMVLIQKFGRNRMLMLASFLFCTVYISLGLVQLSLWWSVPALVLHGMAGSIYYPFIDIVPAYYIAEDNRGRQMSAMNVLNALGMFLGGFIGGFILSHYSFFHLALLCSTIVIFAQWCLCQLTPFSPQRPFTLKQFHNFYKSSDFRPYFLPFLGLQLTIIMNVVFIPLFIYLQVEDFQVLGILVALAIAFEFIANLLFGRWIDRLGVSKLLPLTAFLSWLPILGYIFFVNSGLSAFFAESSNKLVRSLFHNAFNTPFNRAIKSEFKDQIIFAGTAYQLTLCLFELLFLSALALLALLIGQKIFIVGFILGGVGFLICAYAISHKRFKHFQNLTD